MSRQMLREAADEVTAVEAEVADSEVRERLETLADRLQSQAERDTTPALGTLDRVQNALREIGADTDDETVEKGLVAARDRIFAFLETLDDRGMKQHGRSEP